MFNVSNKLLDKLTITESGCMEFDGSRSDGYGTIRIGQVVHKAHRLTWLYFFGPIPKGLNVLHKCDNPPCCNPEHLFLGTKKDNSDDMIAKGRAVHNSDSFIGSLNSQAKLTEADIPEIRQMLNDGYTQQFIGDYYGVDRCTIKKIKLGQSWRHV